MTERAHVAWVSQIGRRARVAFGLEGLLLALGFVVAIAVRLVLIPDGHVWGDLDQYATWTHRLATDVPFGAAYDLGFSYMPALVAVFGALAHLVPTFATATDAGDVLARVALKIPPLIGDCACAVGVYLMARGRLEARAGAAVAVLVVPATWYLSSWWGQYDSIYVAMAVWVAVLAVRDRKVPAAVLLGLALMTKPQALLLALPFAAWMLARWHVRRGVAVLGLSLLVAAASWLPFIAANGFGVYLRGVSSLQETLAILSFGAWNFWWLIQEWLSPGALLADSGAIVGALTPRVLGLVLVFGTEILIAIAVIRRPTADRLLLGLTAATLLSFCFLTTMHERYAYASLVFLAPLLGRPVVRIVWALLAVTVTLNIVAASPPDQHTGSLVPLFGPIGVVGSIAMIGAAVAVLVLLVRDPPPVAPADLLVPLEPSTARRD